MKYCAKTFTSLLVILPILLLNLVQAVPTAQAKYIATDSRNKILGTDSPLKKSVESVDKYKNDITDGAGTGANKLYSVIGNVINIVLGFLGLIALIIVIVSGIQWMTSGGNEDKTKEAKGRMVAGVIGLAIILGAAVLTNFILDMILTATA